jgi:hypothetical protein
LAAGVSSSLKSATERADLLWQEAPHDGFTILEFNDEGEMVGIRVMVQGPGGWPVWRKLAGVEFGGSWPTVGKAGGKPDKSVTSASVLIRSLETPTDPSALTPHPPKLP